MTNTNTISNITETPVVDYNALEPNAVGITIELHNVTKRYAMFAKPEDRLKQMLIPRLQRLVHVAPSRYFREFTAVNDVSLTIRRGETIGIVGRNGAGKSTLLQMIVGTLQPTSGSVRVNGRIAALLELGAGFNPEFTGRENVYVNGAILGFSREEMDERFEAIASFAGIGEFIERPVKTYSSGMFVRLAFAVSTAVEPDILIVDEALSVGDEAFQRKCFARIEAIKDRGGTILFVSHGTQTIVQLCDRAILMEGGKNILEGEPRLVVGQYQRLLNADEAQTIKIHNEIAAISSSDTSPGTQSITTTEAREPETQSFFDPSLHSASEINYESTGAIIGTPFIKDNKGNVVNNLTRGQRYTYEYEVNFISDAQNVGFGMLIKTTSGLELGGATTVYNEEKRVSSAGKGTRVHVRFGFDCIFTSGTYFMNAGVVSKINGDIIYLHRRLDVLVFRVIADRDLTATGMIDIRAEPIWTVIAPD